MVAVGDWVYYKGNKTTKYRVTGTIAVDGRTMYELEWSDGGARIQRGHLWADECIPVEEPQKLNSFITW